MQGRGVPVFELTVWSIWQHRNQAVFVGVAFELGRLVLLVRHLAAEINAQAINSVKTHPIFHVSQLTSIKPDRPREECAQSTRAPPDVAD